MNKIQAAYNFGRRVIETFGIINYGSAVRYYESCPIENIATIIIDDEFGLKRLLEKTAQKDPLEWGTVFRMHVEKDVCIVHKILEPEVAEQRRYVYGCTPFSLRFNCFKRAFDGYNGDQHYHPPDSKSHLRLSGVDNYTINAIDRRCSSRWFDLLTFNILERSEIIGFNKRYTYLPVNKSKTKLVRATPKQIVDYIYGGK